MILYSIGRNKNGYVYCMYFMYCRRLYFENGAGSTEVRGKRMRYLSFFSGIGAFEKALDRLNIKYELLGYSEIDKYASKSYSAIHNVPESMNLGDITKINEKELPKDIDLITYGFPCQDISNAGKMKGLFNEDGTQTRSGLFFDALRIIEATKPKVAIAENVKNLTSKKFSETFEIVLELLEEAGYNNYWRVINAKDFGVPQNRERVFIVSIRKDIDNKEFDFPNGFPLKTILKDLLEENVDQSYFIDSEYTLFDIKKDNAEKPRLQQVGELKIKAMDCVKRIYSPEGLAPTLTNMQGGNRQPKVLVNEKPRKLTPKECFRLMDFEDSDFEKAQKGNSNSQLYKQAGNSIVVSVPKAIFKNLIEANIL